MAVELKKFLDQQGVTTLWGKVAAKVAEEKARAEAAEQAAAKAASDAAAAAKAAQDDVDALETYVGTIPSNYTESNVVAYVNKKAEETLAAATGGSSESAATVLAALNSYKAENDPKVTANTEAIAKLNANSETEGSVDYKIAQAVAAIMENPDETINSIQELVTWIEDHAADALELSNQVTTNKNDISGLKGLVGDVAVATQISNAITAALKVEGADKYALASDLTALVTRVANNEAAITALQTLTGKLGTMANEKAEDYVKKTEAPGYDDILTKTVAGTTYATISTVDGVTSRVVALENKPAVSITSAQITAWDAAEGNAKSYTDGQITALTTSINTNIVALSTAEIEAAIASATV